MNRSMNKWITTHMYIWSRVPCSHPPPWDGGGYDAPVVVYIHTYLHTYLPTYVHTYIHTITLPYLTLPYLTLHYLTLHSIHTYIPLHYITLPYITLPYLTLPYLTFHTYIHPCMHACMHTYIHTYQHTNIPTYQHTNIPTYHHHRPQGGGDQKNHTTTTGHRGGGPEEPYHHHRPQGGGTRRTRRYCPPIPIGGGGEGAWPTLHHIYIHTHTYAKTFLPWLEYLDQSSKWMVTGSSRRSVAKFLRGMIVEACPKPGTFSCNPWNSPTIRLFLQTVDSPIWFIARNNSFEHFYGPQFFGTHLSICIFIYMHTCVHTYNSILYLYFTKSTHVQLHICIYIYSYVPRSKLDCILILGDGHRSINRIYMPLVRIPNVTWITINYTPCFGHGTYTIRMYVDVYIYKCNVM